MPADKELLDRLPPQNREAEQSVLGSMLRDNACINDLLQLLRKDDFYADAHQKIFETIISLHDRGGQPVDLVILAEELKKRGYLEDVGAYAYLGELWEATPTAANAEYYAQIVRDKALVRNLIRAGNDILGNAYKQSMPADQLIESAERQIMEVATKGIVGKLYTLEEAIQDTYDRIDQRTLGSEMAASGILTGFTDLDDLTAGLHRSELVIIAARPSVGKTAFSLALARNIVVNEKAPVFFVSLEQSRVELAERLLCSQAKVDSHRLRKGTLTSDDMERLIEAGGVLRAAPLTIDDTPAQGILRIAANARRLKRQLNIRAVFIDYLQLIEPDNRRDPRHEQVAQISRRLKFLARELEIPVVALAQVNRASEDRQDHRPRLSDLRESGCLTGDTLVTLADSGRRVPIRELVGRQGVSVWSLDERSLRLRPAEVSRAFCTGVKPVYRLRTRLGRCIRATANHPFRAYQGWRRLDELAVGDYVAVPRVLPCGGRNTLSAAEAGLLGHLIGDGCTLPRHTIQYTTRERDLADRVAALAVEVFGARICPRVVAERTWFQVYLTASERLTHGRHNAVAEWLAGLGVFGLRSWEKRVPDVVFEQPHEVVSAFLRSLWATDGCIRPAGRVTHYPAVYYASSSEALADGVQALLLRLGINGRRRMQCQGEKGRPQHQVWVSGHDDLFRFTHQVGAAGAYRCEALAAVERGLESQTANTNRDVIPCLVWHDRAVPLMRERGISMRSMQAAMGMAFCGSSLYKHNLSRERLARVATAVGGDEVLTALAGSDVYWDRVESIEPAGEEEVFDLTVPGPHNFVANEIVVHNSIEQDADAVLMLHRPDRYEPGQQEGVIEIIVAKNRQGPVGEVTLAYIKQYLRYEDFKVGTPFDG